MIVIVLILVSATVQMVSATGEQTWYFTETEASDNISSSNPTYNMIMTKGAEGGNNVITLQPRERVWFYADHVAQCDVGFPEDKWSVAYWVKALNSSEAGEGCVYTRLCYIDSTGSFTMASNSASEAITTPQNIEEIVENWFADNNVLAFTVPEGGRLAIEVLWGSNPLGNLEIHCNPPDKPASKVTSPSTDPGYPVPELSTLVLFSAGLLILAGYAYMGRGNK
jgi:hypothetical protein